MMFSCKLVIYFSPAGKQRDHLEHLGRTPHLRGAAFYRADDVAPRRFLQRFRTA